MSGTTTRRRKNAALPAITVDAAHLDRLIRLGEAALDRHPEVADALLRELDRAKVIDSAAFPPGVANIGSWVAYRERESGQERVVQLVYPDEADISRGRISVLTPIGVALLGLSPGQTMRWETRNGDARDLEVTAVSQEEPAAG